MIRFTSAICALGAACLATAAARAQSDTPPPEVLPGLVYDERALAVAERAETDLIIDTLLDGDDLARLTEDLAANRPVETASLRLQAASGSWTLGNTSIFAVPVFNTREDDVPGGDQETETRGLSAGAETKFDNGVRIGGTLSYLEQDFESPVQSTRTDRTTQAVSGYVSVPLNDALTARGGMTASWSDVELARTVFGFDFDGDTEAAATAFFLDLAGRRRVGDWLLTSEARLTRSDSEQDAYTESSGLQVAARDSVRTSARIGAGAGRLLEVGSGRWLHAAAKLRWSEELDGPDAGSSREDGGAATVSLNLLSRSGLTAGLTASRAFARDDAEDWKVSGSARWRF